MLYEISLLAAYIAGMVALFAPCCISYLLPAYFGNIFRERRRVALMTLVYSSGIFVVMLPVVLGAKVLSDLFFQLHDQTYIIGGAIMVAVGVLSFLGIKMPMLHLGTGKAEGGTDVVSTFVLGVIGGITSACCAPVLVGVMALSSMSPTMLQSLGVGVAYVMGMVTPLYIASLLIDKGNILDKPLLRRTLFSVKLGARRFPVFVTNIIAAVIFIAVGLVAIILTVTGRLGMSMAESTVIQSINTIAVQVTGITEEVPGLDVLFAVVGLYLLYRLVRGVSRSE